MTRPTILDLDLVVVPREATDEIRFTLGVPSPRTTWTNVISASPYPTAWDDVRKYVEGLEAQLKAHMADDYGCGPAGMSKADVARTTAHNATVRAEAAEARIAELEKLIDALQKSSDQFERKMNEIAVERNNLWDSERSAKIRAAELEKRLADAERVIEPFAYEATSIEQNYLETLTDYFTGAYNSIPLGVFRAARAYMEGK